MRGVFSTPSPAKLVPSPYKQGESAMRSDFLTQRRKVRSITISTIEKRADRKGLPVSLFITLLHQHLLATDNINTGRKFVFQVLQFCIALNEHAVCAIHISSSRHCTIHNNISNT